LAGNLFEKNGAWAGLSAPKGHFFEKIQKNISKAGENV